MYAHKSVCVHSCGFTCIYAGMRMHACMYVCIYVWSSHIFIHMYACELVCIYIYVDSHVCIHVEKRLLSGIILQEPSSSLYFSRQSLSFGLKFTKQARVACQRASGICLAHYWDYKILLCVGSRNRT